MDSISQNNAPSVKGKPVFHRPSVSVPHDTAKEEALLVEKRKVQAGNRKWLIFYLILGTIIVAALTCDVPDWVQIIGLILLLGCWVPKTLWNHRAVFIENKMTTFTSIIGLAAVLIISFRRSLDLDKNSGLYAVLLLFGIMLDVQSQGEVVWTKKTYQPIKSYGTDITRVRPHDGGNTSGDPT